MFFGGIQKNSFIDFPRHISCVLFVPGCNFTCPYCHNADLAQNKLETLQRITEKDALDFLEKRRGFLDGVTISGGEPTLQANLAPFLKKIKLLHYPIKIDTNGSRPDIIEQLIAESLLDYIAMDIKTDPDHYAPLIYQGGIAGRIRQSVKLVLSSGIPHEFRTTCLFPFVTEDVMRRIGPLIKGADLYVLQQFQPKSVLSPEYVEKYTRRYSDEDLATLLKIVAPFVKRSAAR